MKVGHSVTLQSEVLVGWRKHVVLEAAAVLATDPIYVHKLQYSTGTRKMIFEYQKYRIFRFFLLDNFDIHIFHFYDNFDIFVDKKQYFISKLNYCLFQSFSK